jgi:O-antigen/teichoic acid export membrane protein
VFLVSAVAALAGAAALAWRLRGRIDKAAGPANSLLREVVPAHWRYARWMMGVCITYWLANSALPGMLGLTVGFAGAGELRVVENLVAPILQVIAALSLLLLPWVSQQVEARGMAFLRGYQQKAMALGGAVVGGYLAIVLLFRRELLALFSVAGDYSVLAGLAPLIALATLVRGLSDLSVSTALKGAARPDAHFWASLVSALFVVMGGYLLISRWGVAGAAVTMLLSNLAQASVLAAFFAALTMRGRERKSGAVVD